MDEDKIKEGESDCRYLGEGYRVGMCLRYNVLRAGQVARKIAKIKDVEDLESFIFYLFQGYNDSIGLSANKPPVFIGKEKRGHYYRIKHPPCRSDCPDIGVCFYGTDGNFRINTPIGYD